MRKDLLRGDEDLQTWNHWWMRRIIRIFDPPFALFGACHYNHYIIVLQKGCLTRQSVEQKVYARRAAISGGHDVE